MVSTMPSRSSRSSTNNEGLNTIGPIVQNLGMRLMRAFTSPSSSASPPAEPTSQPELSRVIFIAAGAENRVKNSSDYRNTSERIIKDLRAAKIELEEAEVRFKATRSPVSRNIKKEQDMVLFALARINTRMGYYDDAEANYLAIFAGNSIDVFPTFQVAGALEAQEVEILLAYLDFTANIWRTLKTAQSLGAALLSPKFPGPSWTTDEECRIRLALIQAYNAQGKYAAATSEILAIEGLERLDKSLFLHIQTSITFYLERAITSVGLGDELRSRRDFVIALIRSATVLGLWHSKTRGVLFHFGKTLREWGRHEAASRLLGECCLGDYHQLGRDHPLSKQRYSELERYPFHIVNARFCKRTQPQLDYLRRLNGTTYEDGTQLSVAYEHIYLNTVIDLLVSTGETPFNEVEDTLQELIGYKTTLKVDTAEHGAIYIFRIHRALARCMFEQGRLEEAIRSVVEIDTGFKRSAEGTLQSNLDLIMFYSADSSTKAKATAISRSVFFDVDIKLNRDQAAAFHRRLSTLKATHFTYESIVNNPLPLTVLQNVGTGAYATVESVKIGTQLYARKSIALPRYSQNQIRQTIQNEISVIRALSNPHIVQIYCTYEEKSRFAIILQPLADCDLEAFLEQHTNTGNPNPDFDHQIWRWLRCLANALAFIHSSGIRHKDIKTRNILVHEAEVIFADFGSSHAFLDEGTSVTEGPAFGHTLMYCAPEVVSWANRGRSADIFSLGCVFTEMATALGNRSISDYYEFRSRETGGQSVVTHAYHATLELVNLWFANESISSGVGLLYLSVIKPMLEMDPGSRPTATTVRISIQDVFRHCFGENLTTCSSCLQKPWEGADLRSNTGLSETDQQSDSRDGWAHMMKINAPYKLTPLFRTQHIPSSYDDDDNNNNVDNIAGSADNNMVTHNPESSSYLENLASRKPDVLTAGLPHRPSTPTLETIDSHIESRYDDDNTDTDLDTSELEAEKETTEAEATRIQKLTDKPTLVQSRQQQRLAGIIPKVRAPPSSAGNGSKYIPYAEDSDDSGEMSDELDFIYTGEAGKTSLFPSLPPRRPRSHDEKETSAFMRWVQ